MRRVENWPQLLADYLREGARRAFGWHEHDCAMWGARWVELATGHDFYSQYGDYETEEEAQAIIAAHGGLVSMISAALGPGHRQPLKGKRGDLALVKTPLASVGIIADDGETIALVTQAGLTRYPLSAAWRIWSV